ncbi:MAG: hypothetical protein Q8869_00275 [Candidatus Phytoplasma australasiaticum]|nr:hypothetical protein [Candidatus Phytoplasma australasiaticum]
MHKESHVKQNWGNENNGAFHMLVDEWRCCCFQYHHENIIDASK